MSKFAEFCARYFKQYFELHPTDAIYYGVEGYDHLLNDYSDKSYKAEKIFVKESLRKLRRNFPGRVDCRRSHRLRPARRAADDPEL